MTIRELSLWDLYEFDPISSLRTKLYFIRHVWIRAVQFSMKEVLIWQSPTENIKIFFFNNSFLRKSHIPAWPHVRALSIMTACASSINPAPPKKSKQRQTYGHFSKLATFLHNQLHFDANNYTLTQLATFSLN